MNKKLFLISFAIFASSVIAMLALDDPLILLAGLIAGSVMFVLTLIFEALDE